MQHHPWILPWGVPMQKMVAVPLHPAAAPHHHHPGIPQPLHPHHHHHHHQHPHPATVHVPAGVLALPPSMAALRTFVAVTQANSSVPATARPRKVGTSADIALFHEVTRCMPSGGTSALGLCFYVNLLGKLTISQRKSVKMS